MPYHDGSFSFSPISFHASFVTNEKIIILDVHNSNVLLHAEGFQATHLYSGVFSPDGCFFACESESHIASIAVWKCTPAGYILWTSVRTRFQYDEFSFSPTSTSILTWGSYGIQLLHLDNCVHPLTTNSPDGCHLVTCSIGGTWIATARQGGHIITILNTLSGIPQYSIDIVLEIMCIGFSHNTIMALNKCQAVRLNLESYNTVEVEINPQLWSLMSGSIGYTLSDDGAQIAIIDNECLILYDVESQQIISRDDVIRGRDITGVLFSPCKSKLWCTSTYSEPLEGWPYIGGGDVIQVEIEREQVVSSAMHELEDEWSFFGFFKSCDGFHLGCDGRWVEDSGGKKIFWLPPSWRVREMKDLRWTGNCLALVDGNREKPIIIQFQP